MAQVGHSRVFIRLLPSGDCRMIPLLPLPSKLADFRQRTAEAFALDVAQLGELTLIDEERKLRVRLSDSDLCHICHNDTIHVASTRSDARAAVHTGAPTVAALEVARGTCRPSDAEKSASASSGQAAQYAREAQQGSAARSAPAATFGTESGGEPLFGTKGGGEPALLGAGCSAPVPRTIPPADFGQAALDHPFPASFPASVPAPIPASAVSSALKAEVTVGAGKEAGKEAGKAAGKEAGKAAAHVMGQVAGSQVAGQWQAVTSEASVCAQAVATAAPVRAAPVTEATASQVAAAPATAVRAVAGKEPPSTQLNLTLTLTPRATPSCQFPHMSHPILPIFHN